ncbi:MAG: adenosylcobalamin-dependent ribonucleoside-diphosphate reductase [Candidatus Aenigmarchaeota archaeon]|nr:adenosylcobalamin-dependent ribonucleoside-diphosphate reductase [Candidatus Aenigmarchaeota archaeon]
MVLTQIKKRDGSTVFFMKEKVVETIHSAFLDSGEGSLTDAESLAEAVSTNLNNESQQPTIEDVQDFIEKALIEKGFKKTAKSYIIYRKSKEEIRNIKSSIGIQDDLDLSVNAIYLLEKRYLFRDVNNKVIETPSQMLQRVAKTVAEAERLYGHNEDDVKKVERKFFEMMSQLKFLPSSSTLMNAGKGNMVSVSAISLEDSVKGIYSALGDSALMQQNGFGIGFYFSNIRPRYDVVYSNMSKSSGPISFMKIFDYSFDCITQSGRRKGANIAIMRIDHPDIIEFINSRYDPSFMKNFNLSVGLTDNFMKAVENDEIFELINPRTKKVSNQVMARDLWKLLIMVAWKCGDPGVLFLDRMKYEITSACGEIPLNNYESCPLGSINLSKFVFNANIDWDSLRDAVHIAVNFLDNIIDVNKYPIERIKDTSKNNRKIGLGIMGFADMLIELGIPYNSQKALNIADDLVRFVSTEANNASTILAEKRKPYPNSVSDSDEKMKRNSTLLAISPTGSISIIANCSSGIEPIFAVSYEKNAAGKTLFEINKQFQKIAKERGFYSEDLMASISKTGSIQNISDIPYDVKRLFVTSFDIEAEWHIRMQEVFQKHVDNAISKTVTLQKDAKPEDVEKVFTLAYKLGCKGVTVYRYGSREDQVMFINS